MRVCTKPCMSDRRRLTPSRQVCARDREWRAAPVIPAIHRGVSPQLVAWRGGAAIALMDSAVWISAAEWQVRALSVMSRTTPGPTHYPDVRSLA